MMDSLLGALATFVGAGGLSGAVAGVATLGAKLYEKKLDQAQERARWEYETALHRANADHERYLADKSLLIESERVEGEILSRAIEADGEEAIAAMHMDGMPWAVGAVRTLTRPVLTAALIALVALIWWSAEDESLEALIVSAVLGLAAAACSFWFGGRVVRSSAD